MRRNPRTLNALAAALLGVVAGTLPIFLAASMATEIDQSFHFEALSLGVAVAVFHAVGLVVSPSVSRLLRFTGVRASLQVAAAIAALTSIAIALWVRSTTELICMLAVAGISNGLAGPTAGGLLHGAVPRSQHGLAFGVQQAGAPASVLLAGLAVPTVAIPFGWRAAYLASAGVATVAALVAASAPSIQVAAPRRAVPDRRSRPRQTTLLLAVAAAIASAAGVAMVSFLVLFAADTGLGRGVAGLLLVSVSAAAIIGRVVSGVVVDRYGRDPLSVTFTMFACCSIALSLLVQATPVTVIVGALTMGAMGWAWHGTLTLAVTGLNRDEPVWAVGVIMSGVFAGAVTGPLLVGLIAAQASLSTAWSLCSVLSVLPLVLVVAAVRTRGDARELPVAARSQPQHASASSGA